jgi:hypothetical protein
MTLTRCVLLDRTSRIIWIDLDRLCRPDAHRLPMGSDECNLLQIQFQNDRLNPTHSSTNALQTADDRSIHGRLHVFAQQRVELGVAHQHAEDASSRVSSLRISIQEQSRRTWQQRFGQITRS